MRAQRGVSIKMYTEMTVNERIKVLRTCDTISLTLEKFGERVGVKKSALSLIESGKNNVTDQMFKSICREFDVSEEWLRYGTGDMFIIPEDEDAVIVETLLTEKEDIIYQTILSITKAYKKLSPESKAVLQDLVRETIEIEKNRKA